MKCLAGTARLVVAGIGLIVAQMIAGMLIPMKQVAMPPHALAWMALSDFLIAGALGFAAFRSNWRGWRLAMTLSGIALAITIVNLIEGVFFLASAGIEWRKVMAIMVVTYLLALPMWWLIFGRRPVRSEDHMVAAKGVSGAIWRFVVSDISYFVLYMVAGLIIFPYVRSFYATQHLPAAGEVAGMQLLIRGPVFVIVCLALTHMIRLPRLGRAFMVGAVFTVLTGVAPLITPNPYFPDAVRWVHFGEVTSSNFVFSVLVAWLWGTERAALQKAEKAAA